MISKKEQIVIYKIKDLKDKYEDMNVGFQKNKILLAVRNIIKTRIRKNNNTLYVNAPSREIRKWFELRKI